MDIQPRLKAHRGGSAAARIRRTSCLYLGRGGLMGELSRRQLLAGSAVVALGAAAAPALAGCSHHSDAAATGHGDWVEQETTLDGHKVRLRAYNGKIPGPLIEARPGDTLRIRLKNSLPPYDSSAWSGDHNGPHGLDATNLHVHGLDVVPHIFEPVA